jgi:hypothetical protein
MRLGPCTFTLLVALHASVSAADDEILTQPLDHKQATAVTLRAINLRDPFPREEPALEAVLPPERWIDRMRLNKHGLRYQDTVRLGGHDYVFNVKGPLLKGKERLGLSFEVRF